MRKITLLVMLCMIFTLAKATVVLDEIFNYTVANLGLESTWTTTGTLTTGTGRTFESTGMVYTNTGGTYILSGLGKTLNNNYQAGTNYISYKSFTAITSGTVYLSFLYKANGDQGQTASEIMGLADQTTNSAVKPWAGKQADQTKNPFRMGLTRVSTTAADIQYVTSTTFVPGTVYLIVVKYDFSSAKASLFINPILASSTEPTADASDNTLGTARVSLSKIMFKHNGSSAANFYVSGARVSTTWGEAVAALSTAAKLSTPVVEAASTPTATDFTANWIPVANAVNYTVKTYLGTSLISSTLAIGQATSNVTVTGLLSGLAYTYTVTAVGDFTNYSNSDPSVASVSVTTLDPYASNAINTDFGDGTWGTVSTSAFITGLYPSGSIKGFDFAASGLYIGTGRGPKGETHTNRIALDKVSNSSRVTLPTVNSIQQIEIHGAAGTAGNGFSLKELNASTNTWDLIGTYTYDASSKNANLDSIYIIPISRSVPTKLRIENASAGGYYLWKVITRTTNPALLVRPVINQAASVTGSGFTASWESVPNAVGYKVLVYNYGSLRSTFTVSDPAATAFAVAGMDTAAVCTYKVQATGDGSLNYSDSYLSYYWTPLANFAVTRIATPVVGVASSITQNGFTANWTTVSDATGYDVLLFQGATLLSTTSVTGQANASLAIVGLATSTAFTYQVIARGDGLTTFDSYASISSAQVTTDLGTGIKQTASLSFITASNKTILCSESGQIRVYNVQGEQVLQANLTNKLVTTLESGLYIVRFTGKDGEQRSCKIVIR